MIRSASPQFRLAMIFVLRRTDGQKDVHMCAYGLATCMKIVITTGRDCGRPRGSQKSASI